MTTRIRRMGSTRRALAGVTALVMRLLSSAAAQTYQGGFDRTTVSNDAGEYAFPNLVITHNGTHEP